MALSNRDGHAYGDSQTDIVAYLREYAADNGKPLAHTVDCRCRCSRAVFVLGIDDNEGAAIRACEPCDLEVPIGDSAEYLEEAEIEQCECLCGGSTFEVTVGVSLYDGSEDVRWVYIGCRCTDCGLVGCYGDWKVEYPGYREFLARA